MKFEKKLIFRRLSMEELKKKFNVLANFMKISDKNSKN